MNIAIIGHTSQRSLPTIGVLLRMLASRQDVSLMVERRFLAYLLRQLPPAELPPHLLEAPGERVPSDAELIISLGGDGTFLRAAHWAADSLIPIFGINTGHLGYLVAEMPRDLSSIAENIFSRPWRVQPRSVLRVMAENAFLPPALPAFALNEVAVVKDNTSSMIVCHAWLDGQPLASYPGDGLLVATPTGSTAYNLSAGGPIIQPTAPVWAVSPVASHSLTMRPVVVSDTSIVRIVVEARSPRYRLSLDGMSATLDSGVALEISKAPYPVNIFMADMPPWADTLREKLLWGSDIR